MDTHEGACQPTLELGRQDPIPGSHTAGQHCTGKPSVEVTTVISNSVTDAHRLPQVNIINLQVMFDQDPLMMLPQLGAWHISG